MPHFTSNAIEPPTGAPIPSPRPNMTGTRKSVIKGQFLCTARCRQRKFALGFDPAAKWRKCVPSHLFPKFATKVYARPTCDDVALCITLAVAHRFRYLSARDTLDYGRKDIPETIVVVLTIDSYGPVGCLV